MIPLYPLVLNALANESLELNLAAYVPVFLYVVCMSAALFTHPPAVKLLLSNPSENNWIGVGVGVLVGVGVGVFVAVGVGVFVEVGAGVFVGVGAASL